MDKFPFRENLPNLKMAEKDEDFGIIKLADRSEALENEVQYHLARALRSQGSGKEYFRPNFRVEKKYTHIVYPDFKPTEKRDQREWELEEIRRCKNGFDGMPGKYYYYFNHVRIKDKEKGKIRPDFRAIDLDYFRFLEEIENKTGRGVVCIKRRQVGMSWKASADAVYDCSFNNDFEIGMNSKTEQDSRNLFKKIKYIHQELPEFLRPIATAVNRRDAFEFAQITKDEYGNRKRSGTQSHILSVAPTDTGHAGNQYRKLIMDEAGECFGNSFRIKMLDGSDKVITDLKVGDYVMGPSGEGKKVLEIAEGEDEMFEVIGRRGVRFTCNSRHKLALYHSHKGYWEMTPKEYIALPDVKKRYFQLKHSEGVEYDKRGGFFDPYWLGLWLGDGYSAGPSIVTADYEILHYLVNESPVIHNCDWNFQKEDRDNLDIVSLLKKDNVSPRQELIKLNLLNNKHIPECYLKGDREDRLKLLAGLIDSDGHKMDRNAYEITMARKELTYQILELCRSLGFSGTITEKPIRRLRKNGTYLVNTHYRLNFYGNNLFEIPCRVERKKTKKHLKKEKGRRDPLKTGFTIIPIGRGKYTGFQLEGDPLFLGHDYLIHHNCDNLLEIFSNAEPCLERETRRIGTPIIFGTVGEVSKQGKGLIEFWKNHSLYDFDRFAFWGFNGMIMDEFGNDDLENSIRWIIYKRKKLESGSEKIYNKFKQKYPLNEEDAFLDTSGAGVGNSMNLSKRYNQLQSEPAHEERGMMRPRPDGGVDFVPMPFGKVIVYERPQNIVNGYHAPVDPAEDDDVEKTRDTSNLSLVIMKKPFGVEPKKMVVAYEDRPKKLDEFYEQAAMIAKWYGCKLFIEMNKGGWRMKDYLEIKYPELLQLAPKSAMAAKGGFEMRHGGKMNADKKFQMMGLIDEYTDSEENCKFIPSARLIEQFKVFGGKGADDDLAVAFGWGLILVQADKTVAKHREQMSKSTPDFGFKREGKQIFRTVGKDIFKGVKRTKSALFK